MILVKTLAVSKSPDHHLAVVKRSGLLLRLVGFELKTADRERAAPGLAHRGFPKIKSLSAVSLHSTGGWLGRNSWQYTQTSYFLIRMDDPGIYLYLKAL